MRAIVFGCLLFATSCLAFADHDGPWPCKTDDDCFDPAQFCRQLEYDSRLLCRLPTDCTASYDCEAGSHCDSATASTGTCVANTCNASTAMGDCEGALCVNGRCAPCQSNADCPSNAPICGTRGACTCQSTTDNVCGNYECTNAYSVNGIYYYCFTSCTSNGANYECSTGKCVSEKCVAN